MNRSIFLYPVVVILLFGCAQQQSIPTNLSSKSSSSLALSSNATQSGIPIAYFSFEEYGEMTKACNEQAIKERFQASGTPDHPSIPYKGVRLCESDLLVLEFESMTASQEFLLVAPEKQWFARVHVTSAGSVCSPNDGCDQVSEQECDAKKGCIHFRSVILENMVRDPIVFATLPSRHKMTITDDDFRLIAQDQGHLFFRLGSDVYSRVTGINESLAPEPTGSLLFHRVRSGSNEAVLLRAGEEVLMDTSPITDPEHGVFGLTYQDFSLSPSGRFAFFRGMGWESSRTFLFDIERKKVALRTNDGHDFGVTPDEKTFYVCASNQLSGEVYGRLYRISDGSEVFSFLDLPQMKEIPKDDAFIREVNCFYDEMQRVMTFCATLQKNTSDADSRNICLNVDPSTGSVLQRMP